MKKWVWLLIFLCAWGFPAHAQAAAATSSYNVTIEVPQNQLDRTITTYYDLKVAPQERRTLYFTVHNQAPTESVYTVAFHPATTSNAGAVTYEHTPTTRTLTMPFDLSRQVALSEQRLTLQPGTSKRIALTYTMPAKAFTGMMLGGVTVTKQLTDADRKQQIRNQLSYSLALQLQERTQKLPSDLKLGTVKAAVDNAQPVIQLTWQNPVANLQSGLVVTTTITHNGRRLLRDVSNQMMMAPNSQFVDSISTQDHRMASGKYRAVITAVSHSGTWHWTRYFTVSHRQAQHINSNSYFGTEPPHQNDVLIAAVIGLFMLICAILIGWRIKRRQH
ncbi:hypothetical protein IV38_GL001108 [Lactobacillus selangorensis]|uniref:Uncharacterized protein n=1 Tax=Lactobacillus selangorensis TaxID=81857 RepID=A0A0R2FVK9_9LACO|nr:DUF916 and DUF3324 domain-containing protein [Lactobacillus selangorensis]KRN28900.1 hypothetical protein IV38_GL001108 [Lactobacillus selangorensis]KRN32690.1 hypothetical protein IV40_GL000745 [Lactobacillus selangorensis]